MALIVCLAHGHNLKLAWILRVWPVLDMPIHSICIFRLVPSATQFTDNLAADYECMTQCAASEILSRCYCMSLTWLLTYPVHIPVYQLEQQSLWARHSCWTHILMVTYMQRHSPLRCIPHAALQSFTVHIKLMAGASWGFSLNKQIWRHWRQILLTWVSSVLQWCMHWKGVKACRARGNPHTPARIGLHAVCRCMNVSPWCFKGRQPHLISTLVLRFWWVKSHKHVSSRTTTQVTGQLCKIDD